MVIDDDVIVTRPRALECAMAMLHYFERKSPQEKLVVSSVVSSLSGKRAPISERRCEAPNETGSLREKAREVHLARRAQIGIYAAENEATCVVRHLSKVLDRNVPETTAGSS